MTRTIVGHFRDRASADAAVDELAQRGFGRDHVSVVERGRERADAEGAPVSAGEGAAVGGVAGLLIGVGTSSCPASALSWPPGPSRRRWRAR
jgi:hypothetical protein